MLVQEIEWIEPEKAFATLAHLPGLTFLDSAARDPQMGRASYICLDPVATIRTAAPSMADALKSMSRHMPATPEREAGPLPFCGGLVGMISYETGLSSHNLTSRKAYDPDIPAFIVRRYELTIGFDLLAQRAWICAGEQNTVSANEKIAQLRHMLMNKESAISSGSVALSWHELTSYADYVTNIKRAKQLIADGDIYQVNLTTRFEAKRPAEFDEIAAFFRLRHLSPAPFAAFMDLGEGSFLLSASPERFLSLNADGHVETRPIKGTSPRYSDPAQDAESGSMLAASAKDRAENLMICDLLRNDLSQICSPGSVSVPQLIGLEKFASVWHLVSVVTGHLAPGKTALDLLHAAMPGGSITGAPKRRAMEIIDALEETPRGPNYGCVFWMGDDGSMDSSIIIRSLVTTPGRIIAQAGGGIVADSSAEGEYQELRTKIAPLLAVGDVIGTGSHNSPSASFGSSMA